VASSRARRRRCISRRCVLVFALLAFDTQCTDSFHLIAQNLPIDKIATFSDGNAAHGAGAEGAGVVRARASVFGPQVAPGRR